MIKECKVCGEMFECGSAHKANTCHSCIKSGYKYCATCGRVLSTSAFGRLGVDTDKLKPKCKECYNNYDKGRYHTDAIVRDAKISTSVRYCKERRSIDDEYAKRCNYNSREWKYRRYHTDEDYRISTLSRQREGRNGTLTSKQWRDACEAFNNTCAYCGAETNLTMEHVVPVASGGATSVDNIIPACQSCNSSKGKKDMIEWYTAQPFYNKARLETILKYLRKVGDAKCPV